VTNALTVIAEVTLPVRALAIVVVAPAASPDPVVASTGPEVPVSPVVPASRVVVVVLVPVHVPVPVPVPTAAQEPRFSNSLSSVVQVVAWACCTMARQPCCDVPVIFAQQAARAVHSVAVDADPQPLASSNASSVLHSVATLLVTIATQSCWSAAPGQHAERLVQAGAAVELEDALVFDAELPHATTASDATERRASERVIRADYRTACAASSQPTAPLELRAPRPSCCRTRERVY